MIRLGDRVTFRRDDGARISHVRPSVVGESFGLRTPWR